MMRIGLISDTHGLLRPQALEALRGSDHIVHAGDIGGPQILAALRELAPLTAVRGNNDRAPWAQGIAATETVLMADWRLHVLHDLKELDIDPAAAGIRVVVSGHSHRPLVQQRNGVLYVNPGSAGPRRFKLPVTVAELVVEGPLVRARIVALAI
ncbi:metallophosphoesterase family protein [Ideonella sp. BN130291]|uniref:metallophosphoesterase family protein n=1 Tax=Ideonella sp. BN130291 TaxID=3112940 RepID=UPI002E272AD6|nr:metallophosphoesterase family protein [Ideonella sp. BN130291]